MMARLQKQLYLRIYYSSGNQFWYVKFFDARDCKNNFVLYLH